MPKSERPHIGIFGRRNYGKSSFINAISGQEIAIVSDFAGTTTDPVNKVIELGSLGPVIFTDTAGIDDEGELGEKRVARSMKAVKTSDAAILVINDNSFGKYEEGLIEEFENFNTPFFIVHNKSDICPLDVGFKKELEAKLRCDVFEFSTKTQQGNDTIIELLKKYLPDSVFNTPALIGDLVSYGDIVMLITPIDVQAPKGRLILPQVRTIRDLLDNDCVSVVLKEREVDAFLKNTGIKPKLAVTDSQIFLKADAMIPRDIPLTGFSVLFARYKGDFDNYLKGTPKIDKLENGDKVLILESCSHHTSADDIGRVKIPRWISSFTGKRLDFDVCAGLNDPPHPLNEYALVIQCGGCMLTRKQIINRLKPAVDIGVPVTNYGMAIAYVQGVYQRAIEPFTGEVFDKSEYL